MRSKGVTAAFELSSDLLLTLILTAKRDKLIIIVDRLTVKGFPLLLDGRTRVVIENAVSPDPNLILKARNRVPGEFGH